MTTIVLTEERLEAAIRAAMRDVPAFDNDTARAILDRIRRDPSLADPTDHAPHEGEPE